MTVENQLPIQHFIANGAATTFTINFVVEGKDNIKVTANGEVVTIDDYSYDSLTKAIVFNTAPLNGVEITIERVTTLDRSISYQTYNNSFRPETLNYDLDRIWRVLQEQNIIDGDILARIKDEIEWRRKHDTEFDLLAQAREGNLFNALKSYMDTIGAMSVPNLFDGITDNVVITEDGVSQRVTNRANKAELAEIQLAIKNLKASVTAYLTEAKAYTDVEKARATTAENNLNTAVSTERTRATVAENNLQAQINSIGGGNKAYTTYALMVADKANIPAKTLITVTNDTDPTKNGDYQYDGTTFTKSAYDVLDLAKDYTDDGVHHVAMLWFFNPYYEKSGESLYFKPSPYGSGANAECFFIRNTTVPDYAVGLDDFYSQLSTIGADKFKVTSPLGVTNCIRFDATDCLYFDHVSKTFVFGARASLKPVISGKSLMIHNNYQEIGQCIERANILSSLNNIQFNTVTNNSNVYRYASVASARQNLYATGSNSRLTTDANGLVIYDTVARMLYVPTDTIIYIDGGIISLPATNVDIGTAIDTSESTLIRVFWDKVSAKFVATKWSTVLTEVEKRNYILFCSVRHAPNYESATVPDLVSIQGSLTYKIDCGLQGQETSKDRCTIMTGAFFYTKSENYFSYDSNNHTLTIPQDTILRYGVYNQVISTPTVIDMKAVTTSAIRVFWDIVENVFVVKGWSERLNSSQRHRYVMLCGVRDRSNYWGGETKDRIVLDITVPYVVDGRLYGITEGEGVGSSENGVIQNRLDDTVKAVAHRGYSAEAPENTLPAYILAKKKGYAYAETDINFTSDEVPVLLHDNSIDRTSTGKGNITELTFEQVRQYDYGSWKGAEYTGTKIPSYEEFLQLCHNLGMHPYIEIKQAMVITAARAQKLAEMVRRAGLKGKVTYISFNYEALQSIKAYDPYARLGFLAEATNANVDLTDALKTGKNEVFLDAPYSTVNRAIMNYALDKEVPVEIWTLNTGSMVQAYVDMGVSGVTTDVLNIRQILNANVGI